MQALFRAGLFAATFCAANSAQAADEVQACLQAYDQAQALKADGKFLRARAQLLVCARGACPALVKRDCVAWMEEVEPRIPSVVLAARDPSGIDLTDVTVLVDGERLASQLDGKELSIDPGLHRFALRASDGRTVERDVLVRVGEKARPLTFELGPAPAPLEERAAPPPVLAYVLGGVGLVGLATFGIFATIGKVDEQKLRDQGCSPNCSKDDTDAIKRKYLVGDIGLAVGVVSLAVAAYLYFSRPSTRARAHLFVTPFGASF
jgi:hypothetical protein